MKLNDKVAIITGATSGIGRAIAIKFAEEGAKVAIVGRNAERAEQTLEEIKNIRNGEAFWLSADVREVSSTEHIIEKTVRTFGRLDILVNCAGVFLTGAIENISEETYDISMNINLKGMFFTIKAAVPEMRKQGKGKIINISSLAGEVGFPNASVYCATKFGVIGLTKALGIELAPYKININAIAPGNIETPMNVDLRKDSEYNKFIIENTPYRRYGYTDDIAPGAVYLASDDSDYVCGATLFIDGGWVAR